MQLRFRTGLSGEQYVKAQGWRRATLARCPNHPRGGCSLARHGTYARKTPPGTRIARWYCPESHTTFSLLPDCLAARLPGTLAELEDAVATAGDARSVAAAAATLRGSRSEPAGAVRWLRRRIRLVTRALNAVRGLRPDRFLGCAATVPAFRARLGTDAALVWLREIAAPQLPALPTPVGFAHHAGGMGNPPAAVQQRAGRDPPATPAQRSPQRPPRRRTSTHPMAKTPDDDLRQAVALFRHGLIADLVNLPPGTRGIGARLRAKAERDHDIPGTDRTRVAAETIRDWVRLYRRGGFDALHPRPRADRGRPRRLSAETAELLISVKAGNPALSVRAVIDKARRQGVPADVHPAPSTVHRLLAREGLFDRDPGQPAADRGRFAFRYAGELWMSDVMHGPNVADGRRRRKTYLVAFIDDATRVVPHAAFAFANAPLAAREHPPPSCRC